MSWDKNTINLSHIDTIIETLDEVGESYMIVDRGTVINMGVEQWDEDRPIMLRHLHYGDTDIWEQMQRQEDCDADDHVVSIKNPTKFLPLEITLHAWQDNGTCYSCGRTKGEINDA